MIPLIKHSQSEVLNQELIFTFEVISVENAIPIKARIGTVAEPVLNGKLINIYKGQIAEKVNDYFKSKISIYEGPIRDLPQEASGLFSLQAPQPGERYSVFCSPGNATSHVGDLLSGLTPKCRAAHRAETIAADLELIQKLEASHLSAPAAIAALGKQQSTLSFLMGEYFVYKYKVESLPKDQFEDLFKIIESFSITWAGRHSLLSSVDNHLMMIEGMPAARRQNENRFILSMFRIFYRHKPTDAVTHESDLARNLVGTFIPNWLGLTSALRKRSAKEIFGAHPQDRAQTQAALRALPSTPESQRLLSWLSQP